MNSPSTAVPRFFAVGLITAILLSWHAPTARAQHVSTNINAEQRDQWMRQTVDAMRPIKPTPASPVASIYDLTHFEKNQLACSLRSGMFLKFPGEQWIYFVLSSAHSNPEVGDLVIGMNQDGVVYTSAAHVCGRAANFISMDMVKPETSEEFFAKFFSDEKALHPWVRWEPAP